MNLQSEVEDQKLAEVDKPILTGGQAIALALIFLLVWALPGIIIFCTNIKVGAQGLLEIHSEQSTLFSLALRSPASFTQSFSKKGNCACNAMSLNSQEKNSVDQQQHRKNLNSPCELKRTHCF